MTRTVDDALRDHYSRAAGRTRYEGQEPRDDELMAAEIDRLRLSAGETRLCVVCGKEVDAKTYKRGDVVKECAASPACTLDITQQEAADHWRQQWHEQNRAMAGLVKAGEAILAAVDACPRIERGAGGMTIDAQIRRTEINRVPAWPFEELRDALAAVKGSTT